MKCHDIDEVIVDDRRREADEPIDGVRGRCRLRPGLWVCVGAVLEIAKCSHPCGVGVAAPPGSAVSASRRGSETEWGTRVFADPSESVVPKERLRNSARRRMSVGGRMALRKTGSTCPEGFVADWRAMPSVGVPRRASSWSRTVVESPAMMQSLSWSEALAN